MISALVDLPYLMCEYLRTDCTQEDYLHPANLKRGMIATIIGEHFTNYPPSVRGRPIFANIITRRNNAAHYYERDHTLSTRADKDYLLYLSNELYQLSRNRNPPVVSWEEYAKANEVIYSLHILDIEWSECTTYYINVLHERNDKWLNSHSREDGIITC